MQGNCIETDYRKMMKSFLDAGYHSHRAFECEGEKIVDPDGIHDSKRLLEKMHGQMSRGLWITRLVHTLT
ncbi:MAG: hypothetical protein HY043_11490 [Verrucomicrobia bacterium]|nr:hypothetical protein [Verrucomicrobiota bacterium]